MNHFKMKVGAFRLIVVTVAMAGSTCARWPNGIHEPAIQGRLVSAENLTAQGCYRCLQQAAAIYDDLLKRRSNVEALAQQVHDTFMLLALREIELGIPPSGAGAHAHRTVTRTSTTHGICDRLLGVLAARSGDHIAVSNGEDGLSTDQRALVLQLQSEWGRSVVHAYGYVAIDCVLPLPPNLQPNIEAVLARYPSSRALEYRRLICRNPFADDTARQFLEANADFAEVHLAIAQHTVGQGMLVSAYRDLSRAIDAIPESRLISLSLAGVALGLSRYEEALRYYEHVLAREADRDAQLGRVKALTHLKRHDEAIAVLNQLLLDETWNPGETRYWRAVNYLHLAKPERAYADAIAAQQSWPGPHVHQTAGIAALALQRWPEARRHLESWREMDREDCGSLIYLGQLESAEKQWSVAHSNFTAAVTCHAKSVNELSAALKDLGDAAQTQPEIIDGVKASLAEARALLATATYNAAITAKMLGDRRVALDFAHRLLEDTKYGSLAKDFILDIDVIATPK